MLFEDNENSGSSLLLKQCYNGANIHFANRNVNLLPRLKELYNENDLFFVFIDVPPNNDATVGLYEALLDDDFICSHLNVFIVPIICIEYFLVWSVYELGYIKCNCNVTKILKKYMLDSHNFEKIKEFFKKKNSLEKLYKKFFARDKVYDNTVCMINGEVHDGYSMFYTGDCVCDDCPLGCRDSLELKAERLYTSLPVFDIVDSVHEDKLNKLGVKTSLITPRELVSKLCIFYDELCDDFGFQHIIVRINNSGDYSFWC